MASRNVLHSALTSPGNPMIKQIRALRKRQARDESGLFLVEGIRPVGEAIRALFPATTGRGEGQGANEGGASLAYLCYAPDRLTSDYARRLVVRFRAGLRSPGRRLPPWRPPPDPAWRIGDRRSPRSTASRRVGSVLSG